MCFHCPLSLFDLNFALQCPKSLCLHEGFIAMFVDLKNFCLLLSAYKKNSMHKFKSSTHQFNTSTPKFKISLSPIHINPIFRVGKKGNHARPFVVRFEDSNAKRTYCEMSFGKDARRLTVNKTAIL